MVGGDELTALPSDTIGSNISILQVSTITTYAVEKRHTERAFTVRHSSDPPQIGQGNEARPNVQVSSPQFYYVWRVPNSKTPCVCRLSKKYSAGPNP